MFAQSYSRTSWNVKFEPAFAVFLIHWIVNSEMSDRVIREAEATKIFRITVEDYIISAFWNEETIISKAACR